MEGKLLLRKVALITGAASGIGAATAKLFAQHGAILSLLDKNSLNMQTTANECDKSNISAIKTLTAVGDITDEKVCKEFIESTVKTFGRIDILVNCAGIANVSHAEGFNADDFDQIMAVNTRSLVALSSLAIPYLKQTQGNIVSIASTAAQRSLIGLMSYAMSKAAIKAFSQYAAAELGEYKVRVNCISPGVIDTPLIHNPMASAEVNAQFVQEYAVKHALGRIGRPSEVAQSILYLASDITASFVTGIDLVVDGGFCVYGEKSTNSVAVWNK